MGRQRKKRACNHTNDSSIKYIHNDLVKMINKYQNEYNTTFSAASRMVANAIGGQK